MTDYYLDSNATGLDDGSSWTNAWASIVSAEATVTNNDRLFIASDHAETFVGNLDITWGTSVSATPPELWSADKTSGTPPTTFEAGASITATGDHIDWEEPCLVAGITWICGDQRPFNTYYIGAQCTHRHVDDGSRQNAMSPIGQGRDVYVYREKTTFEITGSFADSHSFGFQSVASREPNTVGHVEEAAIGWPTKAIRGDGWLH